jgi:xylose isomerase
MSYFKDIALIRHEGPDSENEFAYRHYNPDEVVMGKRMEDQLRLAVAYWHSLAYEGGDPFGGRTFDRPWYGDDMSAPRPTRPSTCSAC